MEIDPKYFPLVAGAIGLIGIAFGTFLTEIRTWLENRRGNKRILKVALYHQYELFGEMLAFDRQVAGKFVGTLRAMLIQAGTNETVTGTLLDELPSGLFKTLEKAKASSFKEALDKHEATMIKLSEVDPLFAASWSYRARSRFPDQIKTLLSEASVLSAEKNEVTDKFVEHILNWFEEKSQKRLLASLEKGIVEIAWRISLPLWWKVRTDIKKWRENTETDIVEETRAYVIEMIRFAMENQELIAKQMKPEFKKV